MFNVANCCYLVEGRDGCRIERVRVINFINQVVREQEMGMEKVFYAPLVGQYHKKYICTQSFKYDNSP